jgi:hypothetical protein
MTGPLHEDLVDYVTDGGELRHPMLFDSFPKETARVNRLYFQKLEGLEQAEADGDWSSYVDLHEKPYRLDAILCAAHRGLTDHPSSYWQLVGHVWIASENIFQNLEEWREVWGAPLDDRRACMSESDSRSLDALSDQFEVWRGTSYRNSVNGLSWTLDEEKATWFARRFRSEPNPLLVKGTVKKSDVLAYFGQRGEREIVSMQVSIISVTEIGPTLKEP